MSRPATAPAASSPRRPTNVTLPESLLREARELGINLCQACGTGLGAEVAATRRNRWLAANRDAMEAWNEHVAEYGYRQF